MRHVLAVVVGMLFWVGPGTAQGPKSPAELMPAKTIAYVELRQPGQLAKEVAGLLEGSYLSDIPDSLAPLKAKGPRPRRRGPDELALVGLFLSQEVIQEFGRLQGAAVAITGIDKEDPHMPEFVVVGQPGDSNLPGFMMRMFMTAYSHGSVRSDGKTRVESSSGFERVAEVEGVGLYREVSRTMEFPANPNAKPDVRVRGPAIARMPGLMIVGSTELVKAVIRRAKGKGDGASLASVTAYKKASQDSLGKPGFFAFVNPASVLEMIDNLPLGQHERDIIGLIKGVVNPKAFVAVADQLTLENATLSYRRRVYLDPKEKSPLLEVLPQGGLPRGLLNFAAPDAMVFAALSNKDGDKRLQTLLDLADKIAKDLGAPALPSQMVAKLEEGLGVSLGKDVLGKIKGVAIALPGMAGAHDPEPLLILEAQDAKSAATLAKDVAPKVFALIGRGEPAVAEEKVGAHTLTSFKSPRGYTLNMGRLDSNLVFGLRKTAVADALTRGGKKAGLLSDTKLAKRLDSLKDPVAVALVRPLSGIGYYLMARSGADTAQAIEAKPPEPKVKIDKRPAPKVEKQPNDGEAKAMKQFLDLLKTEEPLLASLTRTPDHIVVEATYPGLRPLVSRLINLFIDMAHRPPAKAPPPVETKFEAK